MVVQAKIKATITLLKPFATPWFCSRRLMENVGEKEGEKQEKKVYQHYAHADPCKDSRWTAKYSFFLSKSMLLIYPLNNCARFQHNDYENPNLSSGFASISFVFS